MKFFKFWFPVILYSGIIFSISGIPDVQIPLGIEYSDKVVHIAEYFLEGWLFSRALGGTMRLDSKIILAATAIFCLLYGLTDEFHQFFVEGRTSSLVDVLADGIGGALGGYVYISRLRTKTAN